MWSAFFLFVAAWIGFGIWRMSKSSERNRKYLREAKEEAPLQLAHLSVPLQRLAADTRLLRISLDSPIRDVEDFRLHEVTRTAEDLEGFDAMLMNVSRALADWVNAIDRLPERDRTALRDLGVSPEPIRAALVAENWAFERRHIERLGQPPLDTRLRLLMNELVKAESALQASPRVYR
jgi:hypothetical protein